MTSTSSAPRPMARALWGIGLACLLSMPTTAQDPGSESGPPADARAVFALRASLSAGGVDPGELVRLPLGPAVLSACRGDLADLRVFHGARALPFFLRRSTEAQRIVREPAVIRSAQRSAATGGPSGTPQIQAETYLLEGPSTWTSVGDWSLRIVIDPSRSSFARDVELGWTDGDAFDAQLRGTVFRLRNGRQLNEIPIPPRTGRRLGIRLLGQDVAETLDPLEPNFVFHGTEEADESIPSLDLELPLEPEADPGGELAVDARLAPGLLAETLRFETTTRIFRRSVTVAEIEADGSEQLLGRGWIERAGDAVGSLQVALAADTADRSSPALSTRRLRITIDGGDSPPLEDLRIFATLNQPELVFEWPETAEVDLLFGGGRARPPRFDLQQAADRRRFDQDLTWSLLTETAMRTVTLGDIEDNPSYDDQPLLAFLQRPGRRIDLGAFRWSSTVELPEEGSGLYRIALGPGTLSRIRTDFADLRFVATEPTPAGDAAPEAAQWPFLVAVADDWSLDLPVGETAEGPQSTSRIEVRLPPEIEELRVDGALRPTTLELTFGQPFFDRTLRLHAVSQRGSTQLVERRVTTDRAREAFFSRRSTSHASFDVTAWNAPGNDVTGFLVEIEDGDDAPSEIRAATLSGPGHQALLVAAPGTARAVFGATGTEDLEPPTYELQRARDLVQSLRGRNVALEPAVANDAAQRPGLGRRLSGDWQTLLLWAAILLAVLALGWVTLRSVRT